VLAYILRQFKAWSALETFDVSALYKFSNNNNNTGYAYCHGIFT